ncbi:MAG: GNAT family N-acetyltransferase [Xenococcaceae cyanobacterium]
MGNKEPLNQPVLLDKSHDFESFDCGVIALNDFLKKYALQNIQNYSVRTFVATRGRRVIGYYSLVFACIEHSRVPPRVRRGLGKYPVPVILLARLAVDLSEQGQGIGKGLLKDALLRALSVTESIGARAILVHAKDQKAKEFYLKFGFEPSFIDEYHLYLLMKDIKKIFKI